jgi:hypothetical protein
MRKRLLLTLLALISASLSHSPAAAQSTRTWVSGVGDDANPCSRTAPCKTFAGAISKTAAFGAINVLDPGGFGAVTITKSITISSESPEAGVLVSGTNGIVVSASATDIVVLRGLDFEGINSGLSGILINQAGTVHVEKCTIRGFTIAGILQQSTVNGSKLIVSDSIITENAGNGGIIVRPNGAFGTSVAIDHVQVSNNSTGITADSTGNAVFINLTIRQSTIASNSGNGVAAFSGNGPVRVLVDSSSIDHNGGSGIFANGSAGGTGNGSAIIRIGNSSVHANGTGASTAGAGQLFSYKNNAIDANTTDGTPISQVNLN